MEQNKDFKHTAGNAGRIGLAAFGGALIGFVLQLLVAFYFGAGETTDAFFMAQSTSELLSKLLLGGSITAVFIPMFVERITRDKQAEAWDLALNILHITGVAYLVLIILLLLFTRPFVQFIAPGFSPEVSELTVSLLRTLLPSFFFLFLVQFFTSMLHSLKKFTLPALLRIVAPLVSIIAIVGLVNTIGIYSLAIGVVAGSIVQLGILGWGLKKEGLSYSFILKPKDPTVKQLLNLVYPFIFSVLITQGAGIVYRVLVSDLESGSLAALKFAEKITQLLIIIFLNSITLVVFPLLAEKVSKKDEVGLRETIASSSRLIFFITVPLIVGVALLREPLVSFLYQRGSFSVEDAQMTSVALLFLIIGMTTNGISSLLGYAVLALKQTRAAVAVTICSQAIAISLFVLFVPKMGLAGLALASSLVPISSALLYYLYLSRFIPRLKEIFLHSVYLKTLVLALLLGGAVYVIPPIQNTGLDLIISTIIGSVVFFGGAYLWSINEMHDLISLVKGKFMKWRGVA